MSSLISGGFRMFKFCILAKTSENGMLVEIESSDRLCLPLERLRDSRVVVPGRNTMQSRFMESGIEISVGGSENRSLSNFHVNFSDQEAPEVTGISWVPNERHMHWFRTEDVM